MIARRLFLTGPSGCGKSTLLRKVLGSKIALAGGFITDRIINEQGHYQCFYLQRADGAGEREIFLDLRQTPPIRHDTVFTETAAGILREQAPFFLLDEIGGTELLLPEFQTALDSFFTADIPCIGVLKGVKNSRALTKTAHLPEHYLTAADDLRRQLAADPDTRIITLSGWDDAAALTAVTVWMEEYAHG